MVRGKKKRSCPHHRNGSVVTRGEIGNALDISVKRRCMIRYGNECFKIEVMLSICLLPAVFDLCNFVLLRYLDN